MFDWRGSVSRENWYRTAHPQTYISGEKGIQRKGPTFTFVIGSEDNDDIFDRYNKSECPNDKGYRSQKVLMGWSRQKC